MAAHWIVTANRLSDGGVVYLRSDRRWTASHAEAEVSDDREAADAALGWAKGQERVVCDPYVVDVSIVDGTPMPKSARERIRAEGPRPTLRRLGYLVDERRAAAVG